MPFSDNTYTLRDCTTRATTGKALKVTTEDGDDIWVPYSVIHSCPTDLRVAGDVVVDEWWAEKRDLC